MAESGFHVFQMNLQCIDGNLYFPDGYSQGSNQQQEGKAEDIYRQVVEADVNEKHGNDAEEQAGDSQHLHAACEIKPLAQIGDLCGGNLRMLLYVLFLQDTHQLGVGKETVGISQQNQ